MQWVNREMSVVAALIDPRPPFQEQTSTGTRSAGCCRLAKHKHTADGKWTTRKEDNAIASQQYDCHIVCQMCKFQTWLGDRYLEYSSQHGLDMNARGPGLYQVNVGSGTQFIGSSCFNSSPPSAAYMQWIGSALVQIMACRLFGAK